MRNAARFLALVLLAAMLGAGWLAYGWYASGPFEDETAFSVPSGATLSQMANKLEEAGHIRSADGFLLRAKIFGGKEPIKAGEFRLPPGASHARILTALQDGNVVRRFITIPEGFPSAMVHDRLMAEELLTGTIEVPEEGSVLPATYDFERGETRQAVMDRMQEAMTQTLADLWPTRTERSVVETPSEAIILASIVEKETGLAEERRMVAGLYSNRIRQGIMLQADPTIIYPITRGRPLGRRIRQSEIQAINDYNTYTLVGLPKGPIANPGREAIAAVLDPAETSALYMVADGTGGHAFADTLREHNANVEKWFALRRARGEM